VFKVRWRENKVFIQPTEQNVATNLFVWTASGRSTTSSTLRDRCRKWISRLTNQLLIHQLPLFLRIRRASPVVRRRRKVLIEAKPVRLNGSILTRIEWQST